ncbi:ATP-binding protein [Microvirga sp. TS319]|uniref:hybrid sensor histidine kinase/response regulator n=1 Tax=Microvirga sp. TS319 TaxID=3241165 RepID=UPI003519FCF3
MRFRSLGFTSFLALAGMLAAAIVLIGTLDLWYSYNDAIERGEGIVSNLVLLLAEQTERTFQAVDLTLLSIRDVLSTYDVPKHDATFEEMLRNRVSSLPYVSAIYVIGTDGLPTQSSGYPDVLGVDAVDSAAFQALRDTPGLGLRVGHPRRSKVDNAWLVTLSRRIDRPDGTFGGIVVAAVDLRFYETFYRRLRIADGGFIEIALSDGTLLVRTPAADEAIGKSLAVPGTAFDYLSHGPSGVFWGTSPIDRMERVIGYSTLDNVPALVLVGLAQRSVLRPWRGHAAVVIGAMAVLLALLAALVYSLSRSRRREREEQARLRRVQRMESLGRIAGGIAHDFGNTIRVVQTACTLLKPSLKNNPDALSLVEETEHVLRSAKSMTESLLAFARRQDLRPRLTVIDDLVSGFAMILKQAAGPRIVIEISLASDGATCLLDPVQLEATLLNLVLNSRDAMPDGGTLKVETGLSAPPHPFPTALGAEGGERASQAWLRLSVIDQGVGMAPAVVEQAFDPFFTTKGQGNGLGLSQVLGFVQQSNGEVRLESEEGHGTRVHLLFPTLPGGSSGDVGGVQLSAPQDAPPGTSPGDPSGKP